MTSEKPENQSLQERVAIERQRRLEAEALREITERLIATLDLDEVLQTTLEHLAQIVPYDRGTVILLENDQLRLAASQAETSFDPELKILPEQINALFREIQLLGKPFVAFDTQTESPLNIWQDEPRIKSWLAVPLSVRNQVIGCLMVDSLQTNSFDENKVFLTQAIANQAAMAIQNAFLFEQVRSGRERLRALSHRLVQVQEAERHSIARELHDQIGQSLTGLKLILEMNARATSQTSRADLDEALTIVNELMTQVRDMSLVLRPAMLDDLGILPALLWHFERYTSQTQIEVDFRHKGLEGRRLNPEIETAAYRITQEALTNVARYANVQEVKVRCWIDEQGLYLQVEDQGRGFDPAKSLMLGETSGVSGMRERAELLGGRLTIDSELGKGTLLTADIPLSGYLERRERAR